GVGLIVALLSITNGAKETAAQLIHVGRADFGLFQAGTADLTQSLLPESLEHDVSREPGVAATAKIFLFSTSKLLVFGYAPDEFPARRTAVVQGRLPGHRRGHGAGPGGQDRHEFPPDRDDGVDHLAAGADRRGDRRHEHDGDVGLRTSPGDRDPARGWVAGAPDRRADRERGPGD